MAAKMANRDKNQAITKLHICHYCGNEDTNLTPIFYFSPAGKKKNAWKCKECPKLD